MAPDIPRVRKRGAADHGRQAIYTYEQKVAAARADGRMRPPAVVVRLDELDDRVPGVGPGGEAFAVVHLEAPMYVNSLFSSEFLTRRHALPGTERS